MLRILGSAKQTCDRLSRRDMLRAGGLGSALTLADLLRGEASSQAAPATQTAAKGKLFGRAKRVILLYLYGAAAQHETFDPKPNAPVDIRGEFQPIGTAVPGIQICEHLPKLAQIADRLTFVRSMTHPYNIHSAAYTLSGVDRVDIPMELNPYDKRHWPFFGSVLDYLTEQDHPGAPLPEMPQNVALPFPFSSRCAEFKRAGPYGGFLGRTYDPVWTDFAGEATAHVLRWRGNDDQQVSEPYLRISPRGEFRLAQAAPDISELTLDRLDQRRSLLQQLERTRRLTDQSLEMKSLDRFRQMAWSLISSGKIHAALDLSQEPDALRDRYGRNLFGQATLAGRRLLEAGSRLVTVFWDEIETANSAWDTHFNHYQRLQGELLPGLDAALSTLILDLEQRGMLDDTLVLCLTEHGRTPKIHPKTRGVGREHWSDVYSIALAGAGIARGHVVGASDANGAFVRERPVSPKDILTTLYYLLGVDPHRTVPDPLGRPMPLVSSGEVVRELFG